MKNFLFLIISLILTSNASSQDIGGEIIYTVSQNTEFTKQLQENNNENRSIMLSKISENLKGITLSLKFTNQSTYFTLDDYPLGISGSDAIFQDLAKKMASTGDYKRFSNIKGVYYKPNSYENDTTIVFYEDFNWQLLKEKKNIGGYECYKAISTMELKNSKGSFIRNLVVWYCPKISYGYGPSRFGGLPGIILEATDGEIVYRAKSIEFSKKIKISEKIKAKDYAISEEEYIESVLKKNADYIKLISN